MSTPPTGRADDPALEQLHQTLRGVDGRPVGERVEVFEAVNEAIARELAHLDEV